MKNNSLNNNQIISHEIEPEELEPRVEVIKQKIIARGNLPSLPVAKQLELLNELTKFDLGRFMLVNKGLNGYWTHYVLNHPRRGRLTGMNNRGEKISNLEKNILDDFPVTLATQQRFEIFLKQNQSQVKEGSKLACIPCGLMGELLYLNFSNVTNIKIIGIDYDQSALVDAKCLAIEQQLSDKVELKQSNAWNLGIQNEFDLISSNGLNIYEPDPKKVNALYKQFYAALVPGGQLTTSFLTHPPTFPDKSEWDMGYVDPEMLFLSKVIFFDIMEVKFSCFSTIKQFVNQLTGIGFKDIKIFKDKANIFPTVVAIK